MDPKALIVSLRERRERRNRLPAGMFTIKDVADSCGLPQPVIAIHVPRTETPAGYMYTAEQLNYATEVADELRARVRDRDDLDGHC